MKKVLLGLVGLIVVAGIGMGAWIGMATNVRQLTQHQTLAPDGKAKKTSTQDALDYAVAISIAAPPQVVWDLLTDAAKQAKWNSTLVKIDGPIALGSTVKLVTKTAPDRTFELRVTTFEAPKKLVWEDGGKPFMGVRTYTLTPTADGKTVFAMNETLSGAIFKMAEASLPDFAPSFEAYAADLKKAAEAAAPAPAPVAAEAPAAP